MVDTGNVMQSMAFKSLDSQQISQEAYITIKQVVSWPTVFSFEVACSLTFIIAE